MESLASPILVKELRGTSRRLRFYALRTCYVAALAVFTAVVWLSQVSNLDGGGTVSLAAVTSRMADAGKYIISSIAWFQFVAAQIIAALLLSTAISGEITKRTLPALLTTPLSYTQIAMGKVLGGASHVIILVMCSLPLLAIVRVFGGVPWQFVISSIAVTITAAIFAAALSLHYSILFRQPFASALIAILIVALFNGVTALPCPFNIMAAYMFLPRSAADKKISRLLMVWIAVSLVPLAILGLGLSPAMGIQYDFLSRVISPVAVMYFSSERMLNSQTGLLLSLLPWVHCLLMLLLAGMSVRRSATLLEHVAYRKAWGQEEFTTRPIDELETLHALHKHVESVATSRPKGALAGAVAVPGRPAQIVAVPQTALATLMNSGLRCKGNPVLWKDRKTRLFRNEILAFMFVFLPMGMVLLFYGGMIISGAFWDSAAQGGTIAVIMGVIAFVTAVSSALAITSERQARTWPVLLTTTLTSRQILLGKIGAVMLRGRFLWGFLCLHLVVFVVLQGLSPIVVIHVLPLTAAIMLFVCGLAFMVGTFVRQNTMSVIVTLGVCAALWLLSPVMGDFIAQILHISPDGGAIAQSLNPFGQVAMLVAGDGGLWSKDQGRFLQYYWPGQVGPPMGLGESTLMMARTSLLYAAAGAMMAWAACRRFRKIVF